MTCPTTSPWALHLCRSTPVHRHRPLRWPQRSSRCTGAAATVAPGCRTQSLSSLWSSASSASSLFLCQTLPHATWHVDCARTRRALLDPLTAPCSQTADVSDHLFIALHYPKWPCATRSYRCLETRLETPPYLYSLPSSTFFDLLHVRNA